MMYFSLFTLAVGFFMGILASIYVSYRYDVWLKKKLSESDPVPPSHYKEINQIKRDLQRYTGNKLDDPFDENIVW